MATDIRFSTAFRPSCVVMQLTWEDAEGEVRIDIPTWSFYSRFRRLNNRSILYLRMLRMQLASVRRSEGLPDLHQGGGVAGRLDRQLECVGCISTECPSENQRGLRNQIPMGCRTNTTHSLGRHCSR